MAAVTVVNQDKGTKNKQIERILAQFRKDMPGPFRSDLPDKTPESEVQHAIELTSDTPPRGRPMRYSPLALFELQKQLGYLLQKGLIKRSNSPYNAAVLFAPKPDGSWRFCVDYRQLNKITRRNAYPIPLIDQMLDRLRGAKYYTKVDLRSGFWQIPIKKGDTHKTAFSVPGEHYEWLVMPMGLTNSPATFMAEMDATFRDLSGKFVLVYLDDILIFSNSLEEHVEHVREVLQRLDKKGYILKESKCEWFQESVDFLGFHCSHDGIHPQTKKIERIRDWPAPTTLKQVRSFLGLAGFYRRFIKDFSTIARPLTELAKKDQRFIWSNECQLAFDELKKRLMSDPVLAIYDPTKPVEVITDASKFGIGGVLHQNHGKGWQPVAFYSRKLKGAELNYPTHDREMLAVIEGLKEWDHYLLGRKFGILTDHYALKYIREQKNLNCRQQKWVQFLDLFMDGSIEYIQGRANVVADGLSRDSFGEASYTPKRYRSVDGDKYKEAKKRNLGFLVCYAATSKEEDDPLTFEEEDYSEAEQKAYSTSRFYLRAGSYWKIGKCISESMNYREPDRLCIPISSGMQNEVLKNLHDDPLSGHFGVAKTRLRVQRRFYWMKMRDDIEKHIKTCNSCQKNKPQNHKPNGLLAPLPVPDSPWESISFDIMCGLPETPKFNNAVFVVVDRLTKMSHFKAFSFGGTGAEEVASFLVDMVVRLHGVPLEMIYDRDTRFTAEAFQAFLQKLGVKSNVATTAHPETDGQTERMNRTLRDMLAHYVEGRQENWDEFLPLVEFAYNSARQDSTGASPFLLNYGHEPRIPTDWMVRSLKPTDNTTDRTEVAKFELNRAKELLKDAQERQKKYADMKRRNLEFNVGDKVYLSVDGLNISPKGAPTKLLPRRVGPLTILEKFSGLNYKLDVPKGWKCHPVFHISRLSAARIDDNPERDVKPKPVAFDDNDDVEYQVEDIMDKRLLPGRRDKTKATSYRYKIRWKGYGPEEDTWLPHDEVLGLDKFERFCDRLKLSYERKELPILSNTEDGVDSSRGECNDLRYVTKRSRQRQQKHVDNVSMLLSNAAP